MNYEERNLSGFRWVHLDEVDSTNRWLLEHGEGNMVVTADYQKAGKGQGSHTWESASGRNLLFSLMVHPVWLNPKRQFLLSEAWALSLKEVLSEYVDGIAIKWPNDIYWRDKKISGTLIETRLSGGALRDVVIGTGINVNQTQFLSDAPNPVSLLQARGTNADVGHEGRLLGEIDRTELLAKVLLRFSAYYQQLCSGDENTIQCCYRQSLYRKVGFYAYEDANGMFEAEFVSVAPSGTLTLRTPCGELRRYEQREVRFLITD